MPYQRSSPLQVWLGPRKKAIEALAKGHAHVGGTLGGQGRPLDQSKPLAHAHLIVAVGQFQGFVRDLHDLAVQRLISESGATTGFVSILIDGLVQGRGIDRGNATNSTVKTDFARIGLTPFAMSTYNPSWATDKGAFERLVQLRNLLAHGNQNELQDLLATGSVNDTVTWTRTQIPMLNRYARALDKMVWDHLRATTGKEPW